MAIRMCLYCARTDIQQTRTDYDRASRAAVCTHTHFTDCSSTDADKFLQEFAQSLELIVLNCLLVVR
eukprot:10993718-Lingulodinium_polyedra.AAC.1